MRTTIRMMLLAGGACALAAPAALAEGWYASVAAGMSRAENGLERQHAIEFDSPSTVSVSREREAWRVAAGRLLGERFAVEINYSDYGRQTLFVSGSPNPIVFPEEVLSQSRSSQRKVTAWGVDLAARMPLPNEWWVSARVGGAYVTVQLDSRTVAAAGFPFGSGPTDFSFNARDRSLVARMALGVACSPARGWDLELALEHLGSAGSEFAVGAQDRTGRARQSSAWLALSRRF